jgi:ABC-type sugar transport system ATPase subunit
MAEVELKNITKSFLGGTFNALRDINLKVPDGIFASILGPSGCGKTTLLRIVAGLEKPDRGEVFIGGKRVNQVPPRERNIAMVFQNYALYPHKKVFENIAIGLKLRGYRMSEIREKVEGISKILKIEELMNRYPKQLSGGQQQRTALARALVRKPETFLLDEPLSNLDAQVRETTRTEIKKLFKGLKATVLYVTHDQTEAMMLSDYLVVMDQGTIRQAGDPNAIYKDPTHQFVAEFVGPYRINMLSGRIEGGQFISGDGSIVFNTLVKNDQRVLVGIRPEQISLDVKEEISFIGEVVLVEPMGASNLVSVSVGENEIKILSKEAPHLQESIHISFPARDAHFFDSQSGLRLRQGEAEDSLSG